MKISFIIPALNEEAAIAACIEAVRAEAARVSNDAEIIVVDNGSTDATRARAEEAGARVVDEPRRGLSRARQTGFEHSTGELIANVDADVRIPPGWLDIAIARFVCNPDLVALSGPFVYDDLPLSYRIATKAFYAAGLAFSQASSALSGRGAMLQGGNFVLRRSALEQVGGYDTSITFYGEDTDIASRMQKVGMVSWTFALWVHASGRRLRAEGLLRIGWRYAINYFAVAFGGAPVSKTHADIRA